MSSILKVDQLQDSGGNSIITSDGAGNITPGSLNITNSQIASNAAISPLKFGAGSLLNTAFLTSSGNTDITSTSYVTTFSTSYTPVSSSSYLYFFIHINYFSNFGSPSADCYARLTVDGTQVWDNDRAAGNFNFSGSTGLHSHMNQFGRYTNSNTSAKALAVQNRLSAAPNSGSLSVGHNINNGHQIVVWEVST
jgi:hypothetical protein